MAEGEKKRTSTGDCQIHRSHELEVSIWVAGAERSAGASSRARYDLQLAMTARAGQIGGSVLDCQRRGLRILEAAIWWDFDEVVCLLTPGERFVYICATAPLSAEPSFGSSPTSNTPILAPPRRYLVATRQIGKHGCFLVLPTALFLYKKIASLRPCTIACAISPLCLPTDNRASETHQHIPGRGISLRNDMLI
jgi:hypothetical protein